MSRKPIQIPPEVGTKFDLWEVIGPSNQPYSVMCRCRCGTERSIRYRHLYSGHTRSCIPCSGEKVAKARTKHGHNPRNRKRSPTYSSWAMMVSRCTNPNFPWFSDYGGRGIKVCERWKDFANFLADMGERPSLKHSIDRFPDNDGNYEPGNCRWATAKEQGRNKRTSRLISFNGKTQTLVEWSEELGISESLLAARIGRLGWPLEKAMKTPVRQNSRGSVPGKAG